MELEIVVSENKDWIAEISEREGKLSTTILQPVGGSFAIYFGDDFKAFKAFINGLPDGT